MKTNSLAPTTSTERIQAIDVLRGFALFGILLVNMPLFAWPVQTVITQTHEWGGLPNQLANGFIMLFGESKFFSTFSFLFGFGLFMMMERVEARGGRFVPLYLRRMAILLVFGLVHALCFWVGDILIPYAILGTLLLLFRKAKPKTLLVWAVTVLVLMALFYVALSGLVALGSMTPESQQAMEQAFAESEAAYTAAAEQAIRAYQQGTFAEIMAQHRINFNFMTSFTPFIMPNIFAMFLLGLYAAKRGIFKDIPGHLPLIRRVQVVGLGLGFSGEILVVILSQVTSLMTPTPLGTLRSVVHVFSGPLLALGYMSTIVLLLQKDTWRTRLAPLSFVGRMALTNYLTQTLIATTIFYNYGLGLYAKIGPAVGLLLTVVIYTLQIPISVWWMKRFRFGPMEWLWRSLTYLKWQPMRSKSQ
ncbi:MAG: DUF418 domain-containing protein [Chloroflexota bacterium]